VKVHDVQSRSLEVKPYLAEQTLIRGVANSNEAVTGTSSGAWRTQF